MMCRRLSVKRTSLTQDPDCNALLCCARLSALLMQSQASQDNDPEPGFPQGIFAILAL